MANYNTYKAYHQLKKHQKKTNNPSPPQTAYHKENALKVATIGKSKIGECIIG